MAIYPDKNAKGELTGRFRVEVQLNGSRKRGRFDTLPEAKEADNAWREALAAGDTAGATIRPEHVSTPTTLLQLLSKAAPMLWGETGSLTEHGILAEKKVRAMVALMGGADPVLPKVTTAWIDEAIIKLRGAGKSPATINRYLSALHAVMAWGAKSGRDYVQRVPEFGWQGEEQGRIRWVTDEEEAVLLLTLREQGDAKVADFCAAALDTGCRLSELLNAKPEQVDGQWLRLWKTKNKVARSVPLTDRAKAILTARLPWGMTEVQLRYAFVKAKRAMGLAHDAEFCIHALRHTCATRLVSANVHLRGVQQYLGHRTIQTTIRYAHVHDGVLSDAAKALSRWTNIHSQSGVGEEEAA